MMDDNLGDASRWIQGIMESKPFPEHEQCTFIYFTSVIFQIVGHIRDQTKIPRLFNFIVQKQVFPLLPVSASGTLIVFASKYEEHIRTGKQEHSEEHCQEDGAIMARTFVKHVDQWIVIDQCQRNHIGQKDLDRRIINAYREIDKSPEIQYGVQNHANLGGPETQSSDENMDCRIDQDRSHENNDQL